MIVTLQDLSVDKTLDTIHQYLY